MQRRPRSLARTLSIQLVLVAGLVSLLLLLFFFTKYMLDTPALRRGTLAAEGEVVIDALRQSKDLSQLPLYREYPKSYGFRLYEQQAGGPVRLVAEANPELLPLPSAAEPNAPVAIPAGLAAGFEQISRTDDRPRSDTWLLTEHTKIDRHAYWVQIVMVGDPAWRWREAIADEMFDHVILPVLFIVPPLTLAIVLTTRRGLRPLERISLQAEALGTAVRTGGSLMPLQPDHLPLEFSRVVSAINTMLMSLERSLHQQRQFTSDVAHELRTPLSVLLLEITELPAGPVVERVKGEIQELAALVNLLLRLAQAEDMMQRARQTVDLVALTRQVCEEMAEAAVARRLTLDFSAQLVHLAVLGNAALLDIAIRNLIDNAVKWSAAGSAVEVSVDATGEISVADRGPGVPDPYKERIFERFWRAERHNVGGIGIGLALVRRIAQLHGGEVRVEDRQGGGAHFILSLPTAAEGRQLQSRSN